MVIARSFPLSAEKSFPALPWLMVLAQATRQGRLRVLFRNSAAVAINLVHVRDLGVDHAKTVGQSCHSVDEPLPYAVPVLAAVVLMLATALAG